MNVYRYEGSVAVFLKSVVDLYGLPEHYGYTSYLVISDNESPMVSDYHFSLERSCRPIHRYNRVERFSCILSQLLGLRGTIPDEVMDEVDECTTFNEIRNELKRCGYQRYYNSIPTIMKKLGLEPPISVVITNHLFNVMVNDFLKLQDVYLSKSFSRKYFPSLRYIAIKILVCNGAVINMDPIRTRRKLKLLEDIWSDLFN